MSVQPADINSLKQLADQIITVSDPNQLVELLERYSEGFNTWYARYEESLKSEKPLNTKSELESLLEKHEAVANISESLKDSIPDEIARLKAKGRGLLAYTDTLPKKISLNKTTKG